MRTAVVFALVLVAACETVVEVETLDSLEGVELEYEVVGDMVVPRRADGEPLAMVQSGPRSQTIFLNFDGAVIEQGGWAQDNAQTNRSFIPGGAISQVPAFEHGHWGPDRGAVIGAIAAGVQEDFAAYQVQVTTARPSAGAYTQIVVGGNPGHIGWSGAIGVAPLDAGNWNQSDIGFVFTDEMALYGYDARHVAWTITHEMGHSVGLDHIQPGDAIMHPVANHVAQRWSEGPTSDGAGYQRDHDVLGGVFPPPAPLPAPPAPTSCGMIAEGQGLGVDGSVSSCDGRFVLVMQGDGNLVLYQHGVGALWASNTYGSGSQIAVMQGDGNFVVYAGGYRPTFYTGTSGHAGAFLAVQDDGNVVVYAGGAALWSSGTCCR